MCCCARDFPDALLRFLLMLGLTALAFVEVGARTQSTHTRTQPCAPKSLAYTRTSFTRRAHVRRVDEPPHPETRCIIRTRSLLSGYRTCLNPFARQKSFSCFLLDTRLIVHRSPSTEPPCTIRLLRHLASYGHSARAASRALKTQHGRSEEKRRQRIRRSPSTTSEKDEDSRRILR